MNVAFAKIIHFNYIVPYIHQSLVNFCFFKFYNQAVFAAHYHKGKMLAQKLSAALLNRTEASFSSSGILNIDLVCMQTTYSLE